MYDAKRAGRNCFRQAGTVEQPAERGEAQAVRPGAA
jgi:hypothetical protein